MRKIACCVLLIVCFFSSFAQKETLNNFDIFVGKWERDIKKGMTHEFWEKVDYNTFKGRSLNIVGVDSTVLETVLIKKIDMETYYIVTVAGQNKEKPVQFKLVKTENNTFVFENLQHDFPQIIIYEFVSNEKLKAQIKGKINEKWKTVDFNYHKIKE